jgi:hypothetical protein
VFFFFRQLSTTFSQALQTGAEASVQWEEFWEKLVMTTKQQPLSYVRFLYEAHQLQLPEQRKRFEVAVACCRGNPDVLTSHDVTHLLDAVRSNKLADTIDFAMNMGEATDESRNWVASAAAEAKACPVTRIVFACSCAVLPASAHCTWWATCSAVPMLVISPQQPQAEILLRLT